LFVEAMHFSASPEAARDRAKPTPPAPWTVHEYDAVSSTNLIAASLPAWHAVRADTQTAGRGRFQRTWISDEGGLWLSAVVPMSEDRVEQRWLPLVTAVAVCETLNGLGVRGLRLRWPNDVLFGNRKLAGLLIDQFQRGLAVVGIGINIINQPDKGDPQLRGQVVCLAELVTDAPSTGELMHLILAALKNAWNGTSRLSVESLLRRLDELWQAPRRVCLDLDHDRQLTGQFQGVDQAACLAIQLPDGTCLSFEPHEVRLLREPSPNEILNQDNS
jgi:BirA family biotin operon repressor/biotin-[acetyl-CoA-carboxylase] ligase